MQVASPKPEFSNAAWVRIPAYVDANALSNFCLNVEKVFRLNPYLRIAQWRTADGHADVCWQNHSTEIAHQVNTHLTMESSEKEICIRYQTGIKVATYFIIEETNTGANLIILDRYADDVDDPESQVDKSIHAWGETLNQFFRHYKYLRHFPFMERAINHFWVKLSPMARRVTYILFVVTVVEIMVLLLLVLVMLVN